MLKLGSLVLVPSVALRYANSTPAPCTEVQFTVLFHRLTSMPAVTAWVPRSGPSRVAPRPGTAAWLAETGAAEVRKPMAIASAKPATNHRYGW